MGVKRVAARVASISLAIFLFLSSAPPNLIPFLMASEAHAATTSSLTIVPASTFTGAVQCTPGFTPPQCNAKPFSTTNDLAYQGNGLAKPAVAFDDIFGFAAIHEPQFANDGFYGNGASWISNSPNSWVKIDLGQVTNIDTVQFGRDRTGNFDDRDPGPFKVFIATSDNVYANGDATSDDVEYTQVFDSSAFGFNGIISGAQTVRATFPTVQARYVKLQVANQGADVDEVEVFAPTPTTPSLHVTGTVTNQTGGGVQNVSVTATAPGGTTALFGPVLTSTTGTYDLPVNAGTYDIHFVPASGSGLNPILQTNFIVTTNQVLNVQLTLPQHVLSGVVADSNGNPAPGISIVLTSTTNSSLSVTATTDALGHYSVLANADTYYLRGISGHVNAPLNSSINFINWYSFSDPRTLHIDLTGSDQTKDFTIPLSTLSVIVKDGTGAVVPNAPVSIGAFADDVSLVTGTTAGYRDQFTRNAVTDPTGLAAIPTYTATYPSGAICATVGVNQVCNTANVVLNGTATITLQAPPTHMLSGFLKGSNGSAIANATLQFISLTNSNLSASAVTDVNGHYVLAASADSYYLRGINGNVSAVSGSVNFINWYSFSDPRTLHFDLTTADLAQDFTIPISSLSVTVKDSNGTVVANAPVSIGAFAADVSLVTGTTAGYRDQFTRNALTNNLGTATLPTYTASYAAGSICATVLGNQICNAGTVSVSSATAITLQAPPTHVLSGVLTDSNGNPIANASFQLVSTTNPNSSVSGATNASGHYSIAASADTYYLRGINGSVPAVTGGSVNFINWYSFSDSRTLHFDLTSADVTQNFTIPIATLTVTIKDGFGNPVVNAPVTIGAFAADVALVPGTTPGYRDQFTRNATTNAAGQATVSTYDASYSPGTICATVGGNQTCNTSTVTTANGSANLLFQAAPLAPPAPTGLTAVTPTTSAPSLSWAAVSVAASYNIYRDGVKVGSSATTNFVDSALIFSGTYSYTVTAVSALGVESAASAPFSVVFNGQGPVVTNLQVAPNPVNTGQAATLSATVTDSFATVAAAEYFEGVDPGEGNGVPMTIVSGIASATLPTTLSLGQHTFTVRAKNSLGNWTRGTLPTVTLTVTLPKLTGRVLNGANIGLANVRVDVVGPSNHATIIATTVTDLNGNYAATVSPGIYDVIYTPADPTYQPTAKANINLATDQTVDVVLVLTPHSFTGTLKDQNGLAIPGATLSFSNAGGQTVNATTASDGSFTATLNPALYTVTISGSKATAPQAFIPTNFTLSGGTFDLSANVTQNFVIPAVTLTLTARSALTNTVIAGTSLTVSTATSVALYPGSPSFTGGSTYVVATDTSGVASLVVLSGSSYTVNAIPPVGSGVVATQFAAAGPIVADMSRDLLLTANIKHFTGQLTDNANSGVPSVTITLSGQLGTFHGQTDVNGNFSVDVAAGTYSLSLSGNRPANSTLHLPDSFNYSGGTIDLTTDVTQNMTIATVVASITAKSSFGAMLSGVTVLATSAPGNADLYPGGSFAASSSSAGVTDVNGQASLYVLKGLAYATKATPQAGSGYIVTNLAAGVIITADTSWDIVLNRDLKHFSGTITDRNGSSVMGATIRVDGNEQDQHYTANTDNFGHFSLDVAPNAAYALQITGTAAASPLSFLPDNFSLSKIINVTADTVQDVTISGVSVDILARDDRLAPIPNVAINFSSNGSQNGFAASSSNISRTTGADGHTSLIMLAGTTYTISATPPANQGYINTTFNGTSPILVDTNVAIEFQNHIPLAPTGLTAVSPTRTAPVLTWNPVVNADHYKIYRGGVVIGTSLAPAFSDATLIADGSYVYRVSAVSADNFESPQSNAVTVLYDTTAPTVSVPAFSVNPKQVSQTSILSAAVTDAGSGVKAGEYFIGTTDPGQGNGTPMPFAAGSIAATIGTNLSAGTYSFSVRAEDNLGTWSAMQTVQLVVSRPIAPTNLTAVTPTNQDPVLTWTASPDAVKYFVYRDGVKLTSEPTLTTYTDLNRPDGSYVYTVTAVNLFGDESDPSNALTVLVDKTAPTITAAVTPVPNVNGWNNTAATVTFTCSDSSSGIKTCPAPILVSTEGSQLVAGTAEDNAGNTAPASVMVNIDETAPTITAHLSTVPNANGWNNGPVTVSFTCADALSGVDSCPAPITETIDGVYDLSATVVDKAGNSATIPVEIKIDQTAPHVSYTVTPAPNSNVWNNSNVTVTFTCTDDTSGVAACSLPVTLTAEGVNQQVTGTATDNAGNTSSVTATVNIDKTAPAVSNLTWSANPLLQGQNTTLSVTATDNLSGVSGVFYTVEGGAPQPMTFDPVSGTWKATFGSTLAINTYTIAVVATDKAGNTSPAAMDILAVYNTAQGRVSGHARLLPTASDSLPIAIDSSAKNPTEMVIGFSGQQNATTSVDVQYVIKSKQNEFEFSSTTMNWVVVPDPSHASILVHGDLTTYVNGVKTVTANAAMRLDIVLGANGLPDHITMRIWSPGLNPSTDTPTYQLSDDDLPARSNVRIQ